MNYHHMKRLFTFALFLLFTNSAAAYSIFTIGGLYDAVFPASPSFNGEVDFGNLTYRSYEYTDNQNLIIFVATYQVNQRHFKKSDVRVALENIVKGQTNFGLKITSVRYQKIGGHEAVIYSMEQPYEGRTIRKYSVSCYKDGRFLTWTVQDMASVSTLSAKLLFQKYLPYFSVK